MPGQAYPGPLQPTSGTVMEPGVKIRDGQKLPQKPLEGTLSSPGIQHKQFFAREHSESGYAPSERLGSY